MNIPNKRKSTLLIWRRPAEKSKYPDPKLQLTWNSRMEVYCLLLENSNTDEQWTNPGIHQIKLWSVSKVDAKSQEWIVSFVWCSDTVALISETGVCLWLWFCHQFRASVHRKREDTRKQNSGSTFLLLKIASMVTIYPRKN